MEEVQIFQGTNVELKEGSTPGIDAIRADSIDTIRKVDIHVSSLHTYRHQDEVTKAWFVSLSTIRWLSIRLDLMASLFVTAVTFTALLTSQQAGQSGRDPVRFWTFHERNVFSLEPNIML